MVRVGDTLVAETSAPAMLFETSIAPRFYIPPDAVRSELLVKSERVSECPYKGDGQHWHIVVDGRQISDAGVESHYAHGRCAHHPALVRFLP